MIVESDRCMLVQLVRKSVINLMFIQYTTLPNLYYPVMSHLEYITTQNFYLQATLQHLLQGAKHLHPSPLPVSYFCTSTTVE